MVLRCLNGTADFAFSQPYEESGDLTINFNDKLAETAVSACYFSSRVSKLAVSRLISRTPAVQRLMTRDVRCSRPVGSGWKTYRAGTWTRTNVVISGFQVPRCSSACSEKSDIAAQYFRVHCQSDSTEFIKYFYSQNLRIPTSINCFFFQYRTNYVHKEWTPSGCSSAIKSIQTCEYTPYTLQIKKLHAELNTRGVDRTFPPTPCDLSR